MPLDPPRRKPSSPALIVEEVAPGAIHQLRPVTPSTDTATTLPPPADPRAAPKEYQRTRAPVTMPRRAPPPLPATEPDEPTLHGLGPPSAQEPQDDDGDRKSTHEAIQSADRLAAELAARSAELAKARAELEAAKRVPVVQPVAPPDAPTRVQWHLLAYRLGGAVLAILVPCGAYLAYRVEALAPRVSTAESKQQVQQLATVTTEDRVKALEKHIQAHEKWARCMNAERDSAIERGTGHRVESDHDDVNWVEQNAPSLRLRILWSTSPWSIEKGSSCGPEPAPPHSPTE